MFFSVTAIFVIAIQYTHCQDECAQVKQNTVEDGKIFLRLNENPAENLDYKWDIEIDNNNCKQGQRCTLLAWQKIRNMEKHLATYKIDKKDPAIIIDKTWIEPDTKYIIKVSFFKNGKLVNSKQFNVPPHERESQSLLERKKAYVKLYGPQTTYVNLDYYISANINFCDQTIRNNSVIEWKILDQNNALFKTLSFKGLNLKVPSNTLQVDSSYIIEFNLLFNNEKSIEKAKQKIKVLSNGLILKLNIKEIMVGPKEKIKVIAFVQDPDEIEKNYKFQWSCLFEGKTCKDFEESDTNLVIQNGFDQCGKYQLTATVLKGKKIKSETCIVIVNCGVSRTIEISQVSDVVNPSDRLEITATVSNLYTGCLLKWESLNEKTYSYLDLANIPDYNSTLNVTVKEDTFLEELAEFEDHTTDKDFSLLIPPGTDNSAYLKGDTKYLFRINVDCPEIEEKKAEHSHADVEIITNLPPKSKSLVLNPLKGFALTTKFNMSTQNAEDKIEDFPLFYSFGYSIGPLKTYLTTLMTTSFISILPYYDGDLQMILQICDRKGSCSEVDGPKIKVNIPDEISEEEGRNLQIEFEKSLTNHDYNTAFNLATAIIETYQAFNNDLSLEEMQEFISTSLNTHYNSLNGHSKIDKEFITIANDLINHTKKLAGFINFSEELLKNIFYLRSKMNGKKKARVVTDEENNLSSYLASLRQNAPISPVDMKNDLETFELAILNSKDESWINNVKNILLDYLETYLGVLCAQVYADKTIRIETKTVDVVLEKLGSTYFRNYVIIPHTLSGEFMKIRFLNSWIGSVTDKKLCVAKGLLKNYLSISGNVFLTKLYDGETNHQYISDEKLVNAIEMIVEGPDLTCAVFDNTSWKKCKRIKYDQGILRCQCYHLGYFKTEKFEEGEVSFTTQNQNEAQNPDESSTEHNNVDGNKGEVETGTSFGINIGSKTNTSVEADHPATVSNNGIDVSGDSGITTVGGVNSNENIDIGATGNSSSTAGNENGVNANSGTKTVIGISGESSDHDTQNGGSTGINTTTGATFKPRAIVKSNNGSPIGASDNSSIDIQINNKNNIDDSSTTNAGTSGGIDTNTVSETGVVNKIEISSSTIAGSIVNPDTNTNSETGIGSEVVAGGSTGSNSVNINNDPIGNIEDLNNKLSTEKLGEYTIKVPTVSTFLFNAITTHKLDNPHSDNSENKDNSSKGNSETTTVSNIQKANIIAVEELSLGDKISLAIICLTIFGMIIMGIMTALWNRVKRERTIESLEVSDFPKYANIFHPEGLKVH